MKLIKLALRNLIDYLEWKALVLFSLTDDTFEKIQRITGFIDSTILKDNDDPEF